MESTKRQPLRIISDNVQNRENLSFGFDTYARAIAELIATKSNKTPFTIGISGKWGSGKTTLMQAIERELEKIPINNKEFRRVKCVWFEAWKYKEEDEILAALIEVIFDKMEQESKLLTKAEKAVAEGLKDAGADLASNITKLGKSINYRKIFSLLSKAAISIDLTEFFKETDKDEETSYKDFLGFYDLFKSSFDDVLWEYLGVSDSDRKDEQAVLVIFIDDLDRCPLPKIVQILETVKLFMDREGCIFILGAAKDIIEKAMRNEAKYEDKDAEEFLEKIIQINFPLPKKTTDNARSFVEEIKNRLKIDDVFDEKVINTILPILELNPRRIIALFNDVSLQIGMMHHESIRIDFKKLLLWKTLEKYDKGFFNEIIKEKALYESFTKDLEVYEKVEDERKMDEAAFKENMKNPDLIEYLKDEKIRLLINEMKLDMADNKDYDILVSHSAIFEEEEPDEEKYEDFKVFIHEKEKSKTDAPGDYQEFIEIKGGGYDLEGLGKKKVDPFEIGKYPVTNKWYREFMNDRGYKNKQYWSAEGLKWLNESETKEPEYWKDERFSHPGKPVVGISWYEAEAFCNWWNAKHGNKEKPYRLLTEAEWQATAGGKENRKFPWGDTWNFKLCNNLEIGLQSTSVVGLFSKGNTPDTGICDMAGNVWEWTSTGEGSNRIVRGGSWGTDAEYCRVAYRDDDRPGYRHDAVGFRLAHSL